MTILRFDSALFFANVGVLQNAVDELIHEETTKAIIVDVSAVDDVDTTTSAAISVMLDMADEADVALVFARMHHTVRADLEKGNVDVSGHVYPRVADAVDAFNRGDLNKPSSGNAPSDA